MTKQECLKVACMGKQTQETGPQLKKKKKKMLPSYQVGNYQSSIVDSTGK